MSTDRYNEAGRVTSSDGRALPLADARRQAGEPLTGIFATPPSAYIRMMLGHIIGRWIWIPVLALLVCLVMSVADHDGMRWVFAGVILAFCVYPIVMLHLCMRSMVTAGARLCVARKRIVIGSSALEVIYQKPSESPSAEECSADEDEAASSQEKSSSPQPEAMVDDDCESIPFDDIVDVMSSRNACVIRMRRRSSRYLIIPSDAFLSADGAARLMSAVASAGSQSIE